MVVWGGVIVVLVVAVGVSGLGWYGRNIFSFVISDNVQDRKRNTHASNNYMSITDRG